MPYEQLPDTPTHISANNILVRLVDAIGFRLKSATDGLEDDLGDFRVTESAMSIREVTKHIYQLLYWTYNSIDSQVSFDTSLLTVEQFTEGSLQFCSQLSHHLSTMKDEELKSIKIHLRRTQTDYTVWYLINGPLADALTHIGQINSWRRAAGNPCPRISPFTGEGF